MLTGGRRDVSSRQQTMQATIAWSYDLLSPVEQALFRRLSVFAGGFDLELADRMIRGRKAGSVYPIADGYGVPLAGYGGIDAWSLDTYGVDRSASLGLAPLAIDVEEGVRALVDRNLIRRGTGQEGTERFFMLELVREYGQGRLKESGEEAAVRHAHAAAMLAFAEASTVVLWTSWWLFWGFGRIDDEIGNLRAAMTWSQTQGASGVEIGLRIACTLWPFWQYRGMLAEARTCIEHGLQFQDAHPWALATGYCDLGMMVWIQGEDDYAEELLVNGYARNVANGYLYANSRVRFYQALVAWRKRQFDRMLDLLDDAESIFREYDDPIGAGVCLLARSALARETGDYEAAASYLDRAMKLHYDVGYKWGVATGSYYYGETLRQSGQPVLAAARLREGLDRYWELRDGWGTGAVVTALAVTTAQAGNDRLAAWIFGGADNLLSGAGAFLPPTEIDRYNVVAEQVRGRLGTPVYRELFAEGQALPADELIEEARRLLDAMTSETAAETEEDQAGDEAKTDASLPYGLNERHMEVLRLRSKGVRVTEIAERLYISPKSVYSRMEGARRVSGFDTLQELLRELNRRGIT
jgi:non-specific serine/threonine protein kinase